MNKRIKKLWIKALRSGKYKQGQGQLRRGRKPENAVYCCLGVLCDLAVKAGAIESFVGMGGLPPDEVVEWAGLSESDPMLARVRAPRYYAAQLNDEGKDFTFIAGRIEKYL